MKIDEELLIKLEKYIQKIKKEKKIKDIDLISYEIKMSKTTKSIYIKVWTFLGEEVYKKYIRISDHHSKNVKKTVFVTDQTNLELIYKQIRKMIADVLIARSRDIWKLV